ncbi:hypothetical protein [Thiomicrorhabdus lithotrophica]|uniref:Uncharacterized protein n=1 Tax=Thiomicrorhabdus lithotrophica TaxID=2949997 RepID=A0ABY8CDW8_9GAMM|nr:hypothetical protein [Thiomicrorhabdus lithotrophica]WEJ62608.1 hypothetical protein NR989_11425 [Thiomicrorhabdus lithotrophica]
MSDKINQIQASYHPSEDRILLKIKTLNEQVYLAWITRRFMQLLIPVLHGQHPTSRKSLFDDKKSQLQQLDTEKTQLVGDYESEYKVPESPDYPLGEAPILLAKITFKDIYSDKAQLVFEPEKGQGIILPFHADLLGPLIKIFSQALHSADWALDLDPILEVPQETRLQ